MIDEKHQDFHLGKEGFDLPPEQKILYPSCSSNLLHFLI